MPEAHGFLTEWDKQRHFNDHRHEFLNLQSADEYEARGIAFLHGPTNATMLEQVRRDGDRVRFDQSTQEFGVCDQDGHIRTYFVADPAFHGKTDNLTYFYWTCAQ